MLVIEYSRFRKVTDQIAQNYHLQLPPPYNTIIIGGAKAVLVHDPHAHILNDSNDKQFAGVPEFYQSWPASDVVGWEGKNPAELGKDVNEGGCWTGSKCCVRSTQIQNEFADNESVESSSIDSFPFVGAVPGKAGHFVSAGFNGHGRPLNSIKFTISA